MNTFFFFFFNGPVGLVKAPNRKPHLYISLKYINILENRGQSWPNGKRVGLVSGRLWVRISGPAGIVGGGSILLQYHD